MDKASRRQLRLVCSALRAEADALIDTLTLRLDDAACSSPTAAQRMAAFHRCCPAAQTLRAYMPDSAPVTSATVRFADAYASATGPLVAVQQCKIDGVCCSRSDVAVLRSLLGALPQLQALSMTTPGRNVSLPGQRTCEHQHGSSPRGQMLTVLSDCAQLHSLALEKWQGGAVYEGILEALAQLTQLRGLSLSSAVHAEPCLRYLTRLTRLERLGVEALLTYKQHEDAPAVQLPSVHTLCAAWTDPLPPPPHVVSSAGGPCTAALDIAAIRAFPNLQRVEHMRIRAGARGVQPAAHLPALVQRFAGCADLWQLHVTPASMLAAFKEQHLQPGSMAALRHLCVQHAAESSPQLWSVLLQLLLAAAPNIYSLDLSGLGWVSPLPDAATLLQPVKHAAQLQTLSLSMHGVAIGVQGLVAAVRFLAAPLHELHGGGAHCAELRCVLVRGLDGGVVETAAAALEENGCAIRLQRLRPSASID